MDAREVAGDRSPMGNGCVSAPSSTQPPLREGILPVLTELGNGENVPQPPPSLKAWSLPSGVMETKTL